MELNREQIIKALECCQTQYDRNCYECPYGRHRTRSISVITCSSILRKDLLSLVNELTEENERLSGKVAEYEEERKYHFEMSRKRIAEAKADTVRKMQERLHERKVSYGNITFRVVPIDDIDQIAEEMAEGIE